MIWNTKNCRLCKRSFPFAKSLSQGFYILSKCIEVPVEVPTYIRSRSLSPFSAGRICRYRAPARRNAVHAGCIRAMQ